MASDFKPDLGIVGNQPRKFREIGNIDAMRSAIYDNALSAARSLEPVSNERYRIELHDVDYDGPDVVSKKQHKAAILGNTSLTRPLRGSWHMYDQTTGKLVDKTPRFTVAQVPVLTGLGTFVYNGVDWTMAHQQRLRPGVYTRRKANSELESHVNVTPGGGISHRIFMDPESGIFNVKIGQANIPATTLLRAFGATDKQLKEAWGPELAAANIAKDSDATLGKLYERLVRTKKATATPAEKQQAIAAEMSRYKLDEDINESTLGKRFGNVGLDQILATTKKLLAVSRGEAESDDRDHLAFQQTLGPEDLFAERIRTSKPTLRKMLWAATHQGNLQKAAKPNLLGKAILSAMVGSGLGNPLEEVNLLEIYDQQRRATRMGEGGLPGVDSIPEASMEVSPSQLGYIDFIRTPERGKIGVDSRFAGKLLKGSDGLLYSPLIDVKTGETVPVAPNELLKKTLAFPGALNRPGAFVPAIQRGKTKYVPRKEVDYMLPDMEQTLSAVNSLVPMKSALKPQRASMAARMLTQALPIEGGESPHVQSAVPGAPDTSFDEQVGRGMGNVYADQPGKVVSVDDDQVRVRGADGKLHNYDLYNTHILNRKSFLTNHPTVQPGDEIRPGQLIAHSNFTDKSGASAVGLNARTAWLAWDTKNPNFEDAIIVSEDFAKRLKSQHIYQHSAEAGPGVVMDKKRHLSLFPGEHSKETLDKMDEFGVVKPGTILQPNDPMILLAKERPMDRNRLHRGASWSDNTVTWEHGTPGVVTDVVRNRKGGVVVAVKSLNQTEVGDKLSDRMGGKGVISSVIPTHEMPTDAEGKPFDILFNPLGLTSRVNSNGMFESWLGKIAEKTGKKYKVEDFKDIDDLNQFVMDELKKNNVSPREDIIDQRTGKKIPNVVTGNRWFMKLHHVAESKAGARSTGGYTAEMTPAKGGGHASAKRIGVLELHSMLAGGAVEGVRNARLIRGQKNEQYWMEVMSGRTPPTPGVPFVYKKFINELRASGINPVRENSRTHLMALTNKEVNKLAGDRELKNAETVDWKNNLKPVPGGLFDDQLTGGPAGGSSWSKITLHAPMINPAFEEPTRRLLGLTEKAFREVVAGRQELRGQSGPKAIQDALAAINVPKELANLRETIKTGKKTARDTAIRKLGYLKTAERTGIHPKEWVLDAVPVLPPQFRPISVMGGAKQLPLVADPNYLYKELFDSNANLKAMEGVTDDIGHERLALYDSLKAVVGLGDPLSVKNKERGVKGFIERIVGSSPKYGTVQRQLIGGTVDEVGRGVLVPDKDLGLDAVGLPEEQSWEIFSPYVVGRMVKGGWSRLQALEAVRERQPAARKALVAEMAVRPVTVSRAPTLHHLGVLAFKPQLTSGTTLKMNPLVFGGYGADSDGDTLNFHVASTDGEIKEINEKRLPSKNLFSTKTFKTHMQPTKEFLAGLYSATTHKNDKRPAVVFASARDAIIAYRRGEVALDQKVEIAKA